MGSDMSRPRGRRNTSIDSILRNRICSRPGLPRDCGYPIEIRPYNPDCLPPPPQPPIIDPCLRRLPPVQAQGSIVDTCVETIRTSRCSTPLPNPCITSKPTSFYDCPPTTRQSRYNTIRPGNCFRDEEFYIEKDPRHYTYRKSYQQPPGQDIEYIPAERIYEIRKEKVLIKADRTSQSPPRLRSKSSDRYIEVPRTVRIIKDTVTKPEVKTVYINSSNENLKTKLKSRSGYVINNEEHYRSDSSERSSTLSRTKQNVNKSQTCISNDIIYVPMVREEFIKRESQKLNSESGTSSLFKRY